jgi:hypothetical protein
VKQEPTGGVQARDKAITPVKRDVCGASALQPQQKVPLERMQPLIVKERQG